MDEPNQAPIELQVQCHYPRMDLPQRGHASDAGLDLTAMGVRTERPGVHAVDTGVSIALPPGYYAEVVPRSSISKTDFMQANSVGVIDPDYRGRILVMLRYLGPDADRGEAAAQQLVGRRIAQLLIRRLEPVRVVGMASLDETARGQGGFGSTGE